MHILVRTAALSAILASGGMAMQAGAAVAADDDRAFLKSVEGEWTGPGEIVAGKYKGTKFNCTLTGTTPSRSTGLTLDGACRVGPFLQKMTASVQRRGNAYRGTFMDGAKGKGLDIVSGSVVDGEKMVLAVNRQQLKGVMQARVTDSQSMTVTVSVRVAEQLVPVIGLSLKRVDSTAVGSID